MVGWARRASLQLLGTQDRGEGGGPNWQCVRRNQAVRFCRKHLSVGSASRFEPRTARIGADRFQLLCTVCDLPRATTGPLAAKKSPDATNMWGSASVALGLIVSATPGALNKVPRQRPLDPQTVPIGPQRELSLNSTFVA